MHCISFLGFISGSLDITEILRKGKNSKNILVLCWWKCTVLKIAKQKQSPDITSKQNKKGNNPTYIFRNIKIQVEL